MPTLAVQTYLRNIGSLTGLHEQYAIVHRRHPVFNNLVLLKYDQINSPFTEAIVRECRGIILDESNDWNVVSMSFTKFFNNSEPLAAPIDWTTSKVFNKLDGSLATIYAYNGSWHVATTGSPDAGGQVNDFDFTFAELFWKTYEYDLPPVDCNICFYFELTSPYNKIVVNHAEPKLTLLGARDIKTLEELPIHKASLYISNCPYVQEFPLDSFAEMDKTFETMSPYEQEGYVVCDANFNRVKLKHPRYVYLHHIKDSVSQKNFVKVAINGEIPEVVSHFPEFEHILTDAQVRIDCLVNQLEIEYEKIKDIPIQKDFALAAKNSKCSAILFQYRGKKILTIREGLKNIHIDSLMKLLGYKE